MPHIPSEHKRNALRLLATLLNYSEIIRRNQKDPECRRTAQNLQEPLKTAQNPWGTSKCLWNFLECQERFKIYWNFLKPLRTHENVFECSTMPHKTSENVPEPLATFQMYKKPMRMPQKIRRPFTKHTNHDNTKEHNSTRESQRTTQNLQEHFRTAQNNENASDCLRTSQNVIEHLWTFWNFSEPFNTHNHT